MSDGITDTTNAIVPLIGLGIVAGMAGRMIDGPRRTRTVTRIRTVYKNKPIRKLRPIKRRMERRPDWLY